MTWWAWLLIALGCLLVLFIVWLAGVLYGAKHHWRINHAPPTRRELRRQRSSGARR